MKARILIVDDHPVVRSGLRRDLEAHDGLTVVGDADTCELAIRRANELKPDVVMMDVHLGKIGGIEASRQILAEHPFIRIIVFSGDAERCVVDEALQAGVLGYILKSSDINEICRAIEMAMEGRLYLCPEVASPVFDDYKRMLATQASRKPLLTERETQVLRSIAEGLQNKEIADKLGVSTKSVEKSRSRIMTKLGYRSVAELARYAARRGLVPN